MLCPLSYEVIVCCSFELYVFPLGWASYPAYGAACSSSCVPQVLSMLAFYLVYSLFFLSVLVR